MARYRYLLSSGLVLTASIGWHSILAAQEVAAPAEGLIPVYDMGTREVGQTYPLKLTAQNVDCDTAQTFEFEVDGGVWLRAPNSPVIAGLTKGQKGSIQAQLDFTAVPPGVYYGHIASRCTSCGWYIMTACIENGDDTVIKIRVVDPSITDEATAPEPPNPYVDLRPYQPPQIEMELPITPDNAKYLSNKRRTELAELRRNVVAAEQIGRGFREDARNARKAKNNCDRELAILKAKADAAERKAGIAKQDAANADGAAKAAAKELKAFERDSRKALKAVDATMRAVLVASDYRAQVEAKDGTGTGRYQRAQAQVDDFQQKHFDALKEHSAVVKSHEARKAAAEKSKADAVAAEKAAKAASEAAKTAREKQNAKARECKGLVKPIADADKNVADAKEKARAAVEAANAAEIKAKRDAAKAKAVADKKAEDARLAAVAAAEAAEALAIKNAARARKQEIKELKESKKRCEADVKAYSKYLSNMFKAVRDLTNMDKRKITDKDLNVEVTALDMAAEFVKSAASNLVSELNPLPTGETAFTALKAGYDIMKIKQLEYTSGRALYRGHEIQAERLKDKGYAKSKAEGMRMATDMDRIVSANGDTRFFYKELQDKVRRCHNLGVKIKQREAE